MYSDTGISKQAKRQASVDAKQDARISRNEVEIAGIHNDIEKLGEGIAMTAALGFGSNLHTKNHNGKWTVTPAIASYQGNVALSLTGQVAITDNTSVRVGYANVSSDLLDVSEGVVGAAVSFSFE